MNPALRNLLVSDILVRFCEQIPYAFVVIWCVKLNGITPLQFGVLTTVEMVTAMLIYIPVAYLADRAAKKPFVVATFGFFTLFPLVLFLSRTFWHLVVAFIIRGMKEFGEPTRKALIMGPGTGGEEGEYVWGLLLAPGHCGINGGLWWCIPVGCFSSGWIVWHTRIRTQLLPWLRPVASPATNLMVAFGFGLMGTLYFALFGKDLGST